MPVNPAQLSIVLYPDDAQRKSTESVDPHDPNVQAVAARMIEIMFEAHGAGLAAPQVGLNWRLFVTGILKTRTGTGLDEPRADSLAGCS